MTNLTTNTGYQRIIWIKLWKSILQQNVWHWFFFDIPEIKEWKCKNDSVRFWGLDLRGDFFTNGKYAWNSSLHNAEVVINYAKDYHTTYDLFLNNFFTDNFNLHKSVFSLCDQNSDIIEKNIPEFDIINSDFYKKSQTREEYFNTLSVSR